MVDFIEEQRAAGKSESEITHMLLDAGWHMDVIQKTMHGDPIQHRSLDPILDIKKQPIRKPVAIGGIAALLFVALVLIALFI